MLEFLLSLFHCFQLAFPLIAVIIRCADVVSLRSEPSLSYSLMEGAFQQTSTLVHAPKFSFETPWMFLGDANNVLWFTLKALLRMVANHSSVLYVDWSSNARATGRDTWSSTQAWKAISVLCVPSAVLVKTISSPTWRWDNMDFCFVTPTLFILFILF